MLFRNVLRHKLRSMLTIVGVGIAVMAFALLQTVVTAWYAGVEASAANRLITRHAVSFVFPLPLAYRDRIAQVPGVNKVTYRQLVLRRLHRQESILRPSGSRLRYILRRLSRSF